MSKRVDSKGMLVLGMHRSGTSAMARVLAAGGADIGARVLGASAGNETGHWEDSVAVEIHERLLAGLGCRWDEAFALPANWQQSEPAAQASEDIHAYLAGDRSGHRLWAVKDPRLSLFAQLWRTQAETLGLPLGAVVMLRNPAEVAASLAVRDGIAPQRAMLVWLEYTLAAIAEAELLPSTFVQFDALLEDWRGTIERLRALPGGKLLKFDDKRAASVDGFLDRGLRHHRSAELGEAPRLIADAWKRFSELAEQGSIPPGTAAALSESMLPLREVLHPLLDESRVATRNLWQRVERAEGQLSIATQSLPAAFEQLGERLEASAREAANQAAQAASEAMRIGSRASEAAAHALEAAAQATGAAVQASEAAAQSSEAAAQALETAGEALQIGSQASDAAVQASNAASLSSLASVDAAKAAVQAGERSAATVPIAEKLAADFSQMHGSTVSTLMQLATRVEQLTAVFPRHEEALAQLASVQLTLTHTHAELLDTDRAFIETRQTVARLSAEAGARNEQLARAEAELARLGAELAQFRSLARDRGQEVDRLLVESSRLEQVARKLDEVLASRSWRITRPMRVAMRLLTGRWSSDDSARIRSLTARLPFMGGPSRSRSNQPSLPYESTPTPTQELPAAEVVMGPALPEAHPELPDVFVWSVIDWNFRIQRPQHLARALAEKGHRVFYVSVNFIDEADPGFVFAPLGADRRLYQVHLNLRGAPQIYHSLPTNEQVAALKASLGAVLEWTRTRSAVSLVQHPYWRELARSVPNARVVYDCMDHHGGFENNSSEVLSAECKLVQNSELVIVTSGWLENEFAGKCRALATIRNAGEYDFFSHPPAEVFRDEHGRKIIGYYGAIAEWFDMPLVRRVALENPDALVVLVGHDSVGYGALLEGLANVRLVGEVAYSRLPYWLHAFDVCLLPFQVIPLTLATNPVKLYEYLAAGKPVVAVDLPEMEQFGSLVSVARDHAGFVAAVQRELAEPQDDSAHNARQAFAAFQTWGHRADALDTALRNLHEERVSVIVLTYNNLAFTQACLDSIEQYSDYRDLEVIVVDNASSDGSRAYLESWVEQVSQAGHQRRLILNDDNLGFAAGNNVGLAAATGDVLIMLNNDTYVTPGWVRSLRNHLRRDDRIGLVGPVTNNIGNEARIEIDYADMSQMIRNSGWYTLRHPGEVMPMKTVAFFCVALPRRVYEQLGGLDEAFGQGFFEDDDYCRRVEAGGWQVVCAEDVFVHHHLSASFNQVAAERRAELFNKNKAIYERKWGTWQPHAYRAARSASAEEG